MYVQCLKNGFIAALLYSTNLQINICFEISPVWFILTLWCQYNLIFGIITNMVFLFFRLQLYSDDGYHGARLLC